MKHAILMIGLLGALANASTDSPNAPGLINQPPKNKTTRISIAVIDDLRNKRDILSFLQKKYFENNPNDGKPLQTVGYSKDYKTYHDKFQPDFEYQKIQNQNDLVKIDFPSESQNEYDKLNIEYLNDFGVQNKLNIPNLEGVSIYQLQKDKIPNTEYRLIGFGMSNGNHVPIIPKTYSNNYNNFRNQNKILTVPEIIELNRLNRFGTNKNNNADLNFGTNIDNNNPDSWPFTKHFEMSNLARRPIGWIDSWTPPWKSFDGQPIRNEPGFRRSFRGYGFDEWGGQGFTR